MYKGEDLSGKKFGRLLVIKRVKNDKFKKRRWKCLCVCGKTKNINGQSLKNGNSKSCGCLRIELMLDKKYNPTRRNDITGQRFGKLIAVKFHHIKDKLTHFWLFKCDCGKEKIIRKYNVINGVSKSCGCYRSEYLKNRETPWLNGENNSSKRLDVRKKQSDAQKGEKSHSWMGGLKEKNKVIRSSLDYKLWRERIYKRDNWICQKCKIKGKYLHPHHILNFYKYPKLRFVDNNGITFCKECHDIFHNIYGRKNNTKEQLNKFLINN